MRIVTGLALIMSATGGSLSAQSTPTFGGPGGTSYKLMCPEGYILMMVSAKYGQWLDRVGGWCYQVNLNTGAWLTDVSQQTSTNPSKAGTENVLNGTNDAKCPFGYAVKSVSVGYGSFVHGVSVVCNKLGSGGRTGSTTSSSDFAGATGGPNQSGSHSCPDAQPAIGIYGKAGTYVDSFGLVCGYIMPGPPALLTPSSGSDVTNKRPTLDWDPAPRINKPYKVCLNLSPGADCAISGTVRAEVPNSTTKWTPSTDLPFTRGDMVYWRIEACNDNGCKSANRSFRFMP